MPGEFKKAQKNNRSLPDFSRRAITRQVVTTTAQKPYVLYPLAAGLLGGLSALLLGTPLLPALIGGGIGLFAWILDNTLRREHHANDYVSKLHEILERRTHASLASLEAELKEVGETDGYEQLKRLKQKYETFDTLLRRKLEPSELTFGRYLGMAEQLYLGGLDNLNIVAHIRRGLNAINLSHIQRRVDKIVRDGEVDAAEKQEMEALSQRQALMLQQNEQIASLLAQNETAMTKLDEVMAAIAPLNLGDRRATMDIEEAMLELEELALRSGDYETDS